MNMKEEVIKRLKKHNMKYAAMDYDRKWYIFENEPNWVDGSWDVKTGEVMKINIPDHDYIDNRKSLISI
jgi:hypothetical protein